MAEEKKCATVSDVGFFSDRNAAHRRMMEDAHDFQLQLGGDESVSFFGVYDGHGGKTAALFCQANLSKIAAEHFKDLTGEDWTNEDKMRTVMDTIYKNCDQTLAATVPSAGACVVTAAIKLLDGKRHLFVANAGDSRALLSQDGTAKRLTVDHKPSNCPEDVARLATLTPPGFVDKDDRVNGVIAVTRAMGDHHMKRAGYMLVDPHFFTTVLSDTDDYLILACDGVWDVIEDQAAVDIIRNSEHADVTAKSKALLVAAKKGGSTDNLTVMTIKL